MKFPIGVHKMQVPVWHRSPWDLIKVDDIDGADAYKLTADGHSGTAGHWTIQWIYAVHRNGTHSYCQHHYYTRSHDSRI